VRDDVPPQVVEEALDWVLEGGVESKSESEKAPV
jgi:hypothetical protein